MSSVAVVGDPDFNMGFRLVGICDVFDVTEDSELPEIIEKNILGREGIVIIKYDFYRNLPVKIQEQIDESIEPTFVKVGGEGGVEELRDKIRKAIGVDLWK